MRFSTEIVTLIKANIRHKKGSFLCVILLMLLIATALTTVISVNQNIKKRAGEAMEAAKIGDLVVFISDLACTNDMIAKIADNPAVASVESIPTLTCETTVNGVRQDSNILFGEYEPEKHPYQVYAEDGMSFIDSPEALKSGETYVPMSFKSMYDCEVGDTVALSCDGGDEYFKIKAFIEEPFTGAEMITVKIGFIAEQDFERLYPTRVSSQEEYENKKDYLTGCYLVNIYQKQDNILNMNQLKKSINKDSNIIEYAFATMSKEQSISYTLIFIKVLSGILYAFIILLFLVTLIVMGHSINTSIEMDYVNLGILKSQGFTKGMLRNVFVYQYLLAELIGIGLGMLLCLPSIHLLNRIYIPVTGLLASPNISFFNNGVLLLLILLMSCLFIIIKTNGITKISPIRAISGGRESIFFTNRLTMPISRRYLNFSLAFRQLTSHGRQYISSGLIITILVFFMIMVTVLNSSVNEKALKEMFGSESYDISIHYAEKENLKEQIEQEIEKISYITNQFQIESKYFFVDEEEFCGQIFSDPELFKSIIKGRAPLYDNEIVITKLVAEDLGKTVGDTVNISYQNVSATYMISGIFQSVTNAGMTFGFSTDAVKKLDDDFKIRWTDYQLVDAQKSGEITKYLTDKYGDFIEIEDENNAASFYDTIIVSFQMITYIAYAVSILFVFVVVIMVCGRMLLKEQQDFGIYKAQGFTSINLRLQFAFRFLVVAIVGSLLGVIFNILWSDKMMSVLLWNVGISNYESNYSVFAIIIPSTLISLCFFVFAYLIAGKIKHVDTKNLIVE